MKKYQIKFNCLVAIIILFGFAACTKDDEGKNHTVIEGQILDYYTLEPISGVYIITKDGLGATGFYTPNPLSTNLFDEDYSDENGKYKVELIDHTFDAIFGVKKDGYQGYMYFIDDYFHPHQFAPGIYPNYNFRLKPVEDE